MEPRDGALSVLLSSQQETVACEQYMQKERKEKKRESLL
jgi:hypothetical protein